MKGSYIAFLSVICVCMLCAGAMAQSGGTFVIQKSVIAGGGDHSTGGTFVLDGTIGQSIAGTRSTGGTFDLAGGFWGAGGAAAPTSLRGDVAPRSTGDGKVQSDDVVQVQRFQIGLDAIVPGSNEFLRADSAPLATHGDGFIQSDDVIQTQRYQIGLDPAQTFSAPPDDIQWVLGDNGSSSRAGGPNGLNIGRRLRLRTSAKEDGKVTVNIVVDANGDEAGYGFTLNYDSAALAGPATSIGAAGGQRLCNTATVGQVICSVNNFASDLTGSSTEQIGEIRQGREQLLLTITFTLREGAAGTPRLTLTDVNASSDAAGKLSISIADGILK